MRVDIEMRRTFFDFPSPLPFVALTDTNRSFFKNNFFIQMSNVLK